MQAKNSLKWPVFICSLGAILVIIQFTLQVIPTIMIAPLIRVFSIDVVGVGFLSSSYFYTYLFLQVPSGMLVDKFGPRKVMLLAVSGCIFSCFLFSQVSRYEMAIFTRMFMGIFSAPAVALAFALCSRLLPPHFFALAIGVVEGIGVVGAAVSQYLLGMVVVGSSSGWKNAVLLVGLASFILLILTLFFVKSGAISKNGRANSLMQNLRAVGSIPQAWIAGSYSAMMFVIIAGFASLWCVPYLQVLYNVDVVSSIFGSSMVFAGAAIGAPFSGWLSDKIGRRKPIMYGFAIITLSIVMLVVYSPPAELKIMYFWLLALGGFSGAYMIPYAIIKEITPKSVDGTAMGFANMMCIFVGAPIFQPLVGMLLKYKASSYEISGGEVVFSAADYQGAFILMPIFLLLSLLITFFVKETYCKPIE